MSDPSSQPTQALTDEELDAMRGRHELEWIEPPDRVIGDFDVPWCRECGEQHPCEVACLLAEVDRLRAENTAQASGVLGEIAAERAKQETKWGEQNHPDLDPHDIDTVVRNEYAFRADRWKAINARRAKEGCEVKHRAPEVPCTAWDGVLLEEVYEALAEDDQAKLRAELIQVAAVAATWVDAIDRRALGLDQDGKGRDEA